jgi:CRISP-associated protein Cas1
MSRTIVIEGTGHLHVRNRQLMLHRDEVEHHVGSFEDIAFILLEHPQLTFTQSVISEAARENVAVVFCDQSRYPSSIALPVHGNNLQSERMRAQLDVTQPRCKQLWAKLVRMKIANQARMVEARAARIYWPILFGDEFRRHREGIVPNALLNYGYAILRTAVARAIVSSGLIPSLGIHHHRKTNAYVLADDLMEPYRPWVDRVVWDIVSEYAPLNDELTPDLKKALLEVLQHDVWIGEVYRPFLLAIQQTTYELAVALRDNRAGFSDIRLTSVVEPDETGTQD